MPTLATRLHDLQLRALERLAELMECDDPKEARLAATAILKFKLPDPPETQSAAPSEPLPTVTPLPTVAPLSERCDFPLSPRSPTTPLAAAGAPTSLFSTASCPHSRNKHAPHPKTHHPLRNTA